MFVSKHSKFILTPIKDILQDAINSSIVISRGIESYPIIEYILQAIFLKLTGFQEQKGKCLCWDVATNDLEFRYDDFYKITGEYSAQKDKSKIYSKIMDAINKVEHTFSLKHNAESILNSSKKEVIDLFCNSVFAQNRNSDFSFFKNEKTNWRNEFLQDNSNLFKKNEKNNSLYNIYELLYRERNRCAHNLRSYQQNLPDLFYLSKEDNKYNNCFFFFWILGIIDRVYIELYKKISQFDYYQ